VKHPGWVAVGLAVSALGLLATTLSPSPDVALAGGAVAVASAGGVASMWMGSRVHAAPRRLPHLPVDSLGALRGALSAGTLGRERVVFAVQALEFGSGIRSGPSWSPDQIRSLLALPRNEFRGWLESRLTALEQET
jgi:hypothetical protein